MGHKIAAVFLIAVAALVLAAVAARNGANELSGTRTAIRISGTLDTAVAAQTTVEMRLEKLAPPLGRDETDAYLAAVQRRRSAVRDLAVAAGSREIYPFAELEGLTEQELRIAESLRKAGAQSQIAQREAVSRARETAAATGALLAKVRAGAAARVGSREASSAEELLSAATIATGAAACIVAIGGIWFWLKVTGAVRRLREAMRKIRDGLGSRQADASARGELGELSKGFNDVADALTRAQAELKQSSEVFRLVLDGMSDGVVVADRNEQVVLFNRAAVEMLGEAPEGSAHEWATRCGLRVPGAGVSEVPLLTALEGRPVRDVEMVISNPSLPEPRFVVAAGSPVMDGRGLWGAVLVLTDITARKRAQRALEESEERFRAFVETTNEWIWSVDAEGRVTYSNPAIFPILGRFPGWILERPIYEVVHPADRGRFRERLEHFGPDTTGSAGLIFKCMHENGTDRWLEMNIVPAVDAGGNVNGHRGTARDITIRQMAEGEVQKLNGELRRRVDQLNALNKELEAFSYSVSHDLRAPLRSIDGFSQALLEDYSDRLDGEGRDYLQRVRAASQRMAHLIDDLLNLSRVARHEISRRSVDVTELARTVFAGLRDTAPDREVEFRTQDRIMADADPRLLRIVFENLLGNAWKFTRNQPKCLIEVCTKTEGDRVVYVVRDNGVGFDMTYASKLFGAFQRLHTPQEFEGTGIGLATVQRIVNRHGGSVWAKSAVGQGASFFFTLG